MFWKPHNSAVLPYLGPLMFEVRIRNPTSGKAAYERAMNEARLAFAKRGNVGKAFNLAIKGIEGSKDDFVIIFNVFASEGGLVER